MRNQPEQEVLVPELAQHPALLIDAEVVVGVDDHRKRVTAAQETRVRPVVTAARLLPIPVVTVAGLEVAQEGFGVWQHPRLTRPGHESQAHEVAPREARFVVEREIAHHRHPLVLDFAVPQAAALVGLVRYQRAQQIRPVRRDVGGTMLADVGEIARPVLVIGRREDLAGGGKPFHALGTVPSASAGLPVRRIRAADAVHRIQRTRERKVVSNQFQREDRNVDVIEEMQVDVRHIEKRRRVVAGEADAGLRDVAAPEHAHRPQVAAFAARSLAVQKALHVRQESHELLVMALAEILRVVGELVGHLGPAAGRGLLQKLPMALDLLPPRMRDQLDRPQHDLAKLQHARRRLGCGERNRATGYDRFQSGRIRHGFPRRGWVFVRQPFPDAKAIG